MPGNDPAVLVTGATGFVGANVVAKVAGRGMRVVALDLRSPRKPVEDLWAPYQDSIAFTTGDVQNRAAVEDIIAWHNVKQVVHGATITPDASREKQDPESILKIGILGAAAVLWAAAWHGVERLIYLSSGSIYKPVQNDAAVLDEATPLRTSGLYPLTKVSGEWLVREIRQTTGIDAVSARIAACYGPLERDTGARTSMSIVWQMVRLAKEGKPIVLGTPSHTLDFTHVDDVAHGICGLLEASSLAHDVYNVAGGVAYSYRDLGKYVSQMLPASSWVVPDSIDNVSVSAGADARRGRLAIDRLQEETDFGPTHDLQSGVKQYLGWLDNYPY